MMHPKFMGAVCMLFLISVQVGSTPIAMSQITNNLSTANVTFTFSSPGYFMETAQGPDAYLRLEADGFEVQEKQLNGYGTVSDAVPGASAGAESKDGLILNKTQATLSNPDQRYANSLSNTAINIIYNVENVSSVALSLDVTAAMELSTSAPLETAYGVLEESLVLYMFNGVSLVMLDEDDFLLDKQVDDGAGLAINDVLTLGLSHDFGNNPFSGQLMIQSISTSLAGADAPAQVPEPMALSLLSLGMGFLGCLRRFFKTNVASKSLSE